MNFNMDGLQSSRMSQEIALLDTCRTEYDRVNAELEDLRLLLQQSSQEVEKLNQRKVLAASRLREMEEHLEHYARQEISAAYIEAGESEMRAFMISEQRDQWQAKARVHEGYRYFLEHLLSTLPILVAAPAAQPPAGGGRPQSPPPVVGRPMAPPPQPQVPEIQASPPPPHPPAYRPQELYDPMTSALPFPEHATEMLPYLQETELLSERQFSQDPVAMGPQHLLALPQTGILPPHLQEQALLARIIQAEESVRERVASRLHDGPAQGLASIVLAAEVCAKLMYTSPDRVVGELEQLKRMVNGTLQETRKFIFELHPMTLADLGLAATIKRYAEETATRYGVQVPVMVPQVEPFLPMGKRVAIFRVTQEAVSNAAQHGRAAVIRVMIQLSPGGFSLIVEDDGVGFDVEEFEKSPHKDKHLGIVNMQERADVLGGQLRVESAPQRGTRVELTVPL
jgi:signal transduction histidine kinase